MIKKFMAFSVIKKVIVAVMAIVIIVLLVIVLTNNNGNVETITVKTGDFINQVSVSGKVIPSENVDLGFYQGGRISYIHAKVGDIVKAGNVIASVENGDLRANLAQREASLLREEARLKSLEAGTRPEQLAITESGVFSAEISLNQAAQSLVNALGDAYTKSDDAIKNKIDQLFENPTASSPTIKIFGSNSSLISKINSERSMLTETLNSWKVSVSQLNPNQNMDTYVIEAQNNLTKIKNFLDEISSVTNNPTSTYNSTTIPSTWKADASIARSNIEIAISTLTSSVTSYKNAETLLVTQKNNLKLAQAGATTEDLDVQKAQVKSAEADVLNAKALLNKTLILAPFNGQITKMDLKVGQIASPNISMISMMSAGTFQIESYVPEVNIALVKLGDEAIVTLDAYGDAVLFNAKVFSIDPAETVRDGVSTYKVKLQFENIDERIKSGMTANVAITIFNKPNVIVLPGGVVFDKNNKKFVQIKENNKITDREIVTGQVSSLGQIEIISGIKDNDQVILNPIIK